MNPRMENTWKMLKFILSPYLILVGITIVESTISCPKSCVCVDYSREKSVVNCSYSSITELPQDFPTQITELYLNYNNFSVINKTSLPMFPNLKILSLKHCQLSEVALNTMNFPKLQVLDLSYNMLKQLPVGLPSSLTSLIVSYNEITTLSRDLIAHLVYIEELFLDNNLLETLNFTGTFKVQTFVLPNLVKLTLNSNKIRKVQENFFSGFINLNALSIANNRLKVIHANSFNSLYTLTQLDLSRNLINTIENNVFKKMVSLKHLDVHHNRLNHLPSGIPMIEWLDLSYNNINTISEHYSSVLFPIEFFNLGQNPFYCDCNLLWLKEIYDTRNYIIKHLKIDESDFIPHCASPENLMGKTWDALPNELFICSSKQENQSDDNGNSGVIDPENLEVKTGLTGDNRIQILWNVKTPFSFKTVIIQYYKFGERESSLKYVEIAAVQKEFNLKHLDGQTNYIVCLIPKIEEKIDGLKAMPLSFKHCLEVKTSKVEQENLGSYFWILCYYILGMSGTVIFVITFIGVVAIVGSLLVPKGDWSSKYVPVIDEPITTEKVNDHNASPVGLPVHDLRNRKTHCDTTTNSTNSQSDAAEKSDLSQKEFNPIDKKYNSTEKKIN